MTITQIGQSYCGGLAWGIDPDGFTVITCADPEITVTQAWVDSLTEGGVFSIVNDPNDYSGGWAGTDYLHAATADGRRFVWRLRGPQLALRFPHDTGVELRHGRWPD